ncbi:MAG TPA: transglycosylase family protein, partial [Candidatus Limnocylindrales bacterium]|nr:transglycosylase family protein [Candidatus Limnocylindrales bacterium]
MTPPRPYRLSRFMLAAGLVAALVAMPASPVGARGESNVDIDSFMTGLACTESTGRYTAENDRSGAYGKYQIMPRNWRAWAGRYLGNRWAQPTPRNQEYVAQRRIEDLYELRGKWRRVAYWWLTGDGEGDESKWTKHAALYVRRVMGAVQAAAAPGARAAGVLPDQCFPGDFPDPRVRDE